MTKLKVVYRYSHTRQKWLVVQAISEGALRDRRSKSAGQDLFRHNRYAQFGQEKAQELMLTERHVARYGWTRNRGLLEKQLQTIQAAPG